MNKTLKTSVLLLLILFSNTLIFAVPALKTFQKIIQPDGSTLTIRLLGDENFHYYTTTDNYPIVIDSTGLYTYAVQNTEGSFISTHVKAYDENERTAEQNSFLNSLSRNITLKTSILSRAKALGRSNAKQKAYPTQGTPKSLVILVNFSDKSFVTSSAQNAFTSLLNKDGYATNGGTGSAKDYFRDNSMGAFIPEFDVYGPYTLGNTMSFYGANDKDGNDNIPQQMVIDACALADKDVDFSIYDTDKDGILDNVFIYYAGYNEAEGASASTIWPHRWSLNDYNTKFDGISVYDYACTSELKGTAGSNMCGIGTFCHEFGHVLGLTDLYVTDNSIADHYTLSDWDIMDAGPYLNSGRTPPAYSSYERYFLGWLTPTDLTKFGTYLADTLTTSNKAYIISADTTINNRSQFNANNSTYPEYYLLENRQQQGWDKYLPGHGLLVTHIYYNAANWINNSPNNNIDAMDIDIVEADGIGSNATMSSDPFPGTANVNSFTPKLRSGKDLNTRNLFRIKETNGVVRFAFIKPGPTIDATSIDQFTTAINTKSFAKTININGADLIDKVNIELSTKKYFELTTDTLSDNWTESLSLVPSADSSLIRSIFVRFKPSILEYPNVFSDSLTFSSKNSETIQLLLNGHIETAEIIAYNNSNGSIKIYSPLFNSPIYIYNTLGLLIKKVVPDGNSVVITGLEKHTVYIIKTGSFTKKIISLY